MLPDRSPEPLQQRPRARELDAEQWGCWGGARPEASRAVTTARGQAVEVDLKAGAHLTRRTDPGCAAFDPGWLPHTRVVEKIVTSDA